MDLRHKGTCVAFINRIRNWLKKRRDGKHPAIIAKDGKEGAEIHQDDETGFRNCYPYSLSDAPLGRTHAVRLPAKRERTILIYSVINKEKIRYTDHKRCGVRYFLNFGNFRVHQCGRDNINIFFLY